MLSAGASRPPAAEYRSAQTFGTSSAAGIIADCWKSQLAHWAVSASLGAALRDLDRVWEERNHPGQGAVQPQAYLQARAFLASLLPWAPHPDISADAEGEPSFEWDFGPDRWLVASIAADGSISYAANRGMERQRGTTVFTGSLPETIASLLADLQRG